MITVGLKCLNLFYVKLEIKQILIFFYKLVKKVNFTLIRNQKKETKS